MESGDAPQMEEPAPPAPNMLYLPVEVLRYIFEFMPTHDLVKNVRLVCHCFLKVLDEVFFRRRLKVFFKSTGIPPICSHLGLNENCDWKPGSRVTWRSMCYNFEVESEIWQKMVNYETFTPQIVHTVHKHAATVDAVKILNRGKLAVSGARDRCLHLWNLDDIPHSICAEEHSHGGWIWDIDSVDEDKFISCDWNGDIFLWSLTGALAPITKFSIGRPALCVDSGPQYFVVGTQAKELCFLDSRIGSQSAIVKRKIHRAAVMDVSIDGNYVVAVSEDKTLSVTDVRKLQKVKSYCISENPTPVSLSKFNNLFYVADTSGTIKVVDSHTDFDVVMELQNIHSRLTSICAAPGIIITSSRDCYLSVSTPSNPMMTRSDIHFGTEIAGIDYSHHILAVARSDNAVTFFNTSSFH